MFPLNEDREAMLGYYGGVDAIAPGEPGEVEGVVEEQSLLVGLKSSLCYTT